MQQSTENLLRAFQIPFGAAVVVSVPDGRVLALVGQSAADPRLGPSELALRAWAPAASVFKVISAAALVENGVMGSTRTCYHGGVSSILADNLVDLPAIDRRCDTLAFGLGKSQNAIIAKLATRHLTAGELARVGRSFGFDEAIPFDLPDRALAPRRPGRRARVRAHGGRLLALDAVADARRAAGGDHRQPRRDARADADRARQRPRRAAARAADRAPRATSSTPRRPGRWGG